MRIGGRLSAAIEVLEAIDRQHQPASVALADWGRSHRFAGSGDRAAIGTIVFDVLRCRRSLAATMEDESARALVLAAAMTTFGLSPEALTAELAGDAHAPAAPTEAELARLVRPLPESLAADVRGDVPAWLAPSLERAFGDRLAAEGRALAARAPVDLRVNTLKSDRERVLKALARFGAGPTPYSPVGVRVPAPVGGGRAPHLEAETAHGKGWYEVQDEGSQIAALLAGAGPRMQVLDLCAGAGGKTLAMAAAMQNTGQIYAYDASRQQLRPIFERIKRAGVRNVQVLDGGDNAALDALGPRFDVVLVDAPCSGSGTWRRRPDTKWRLKPEALAERLGDQDAVLDRAASLVRPGGTLAYVTCSVLPEENGDRVAAFRARDTGASFAVADIGAAWGQRIGALPAGGIGEATGGGIQLTPLRHGTDGFFIALLTRGA